jgi:type IV secretory pathway VirB2 component (pilin)
MKFIRNILTSISFAIIGLVANAYATGGSEWQPIWDKIVGYINGYPGMIAAAGLVIAGLFAFYRGQFAQGLVAIIVAAAIFLTPTVVQGFTSGTLM